MNRRRVNIDRLLVVTTAFVVIAPALVGCNQKEERVAAPNESSAAPARLPGEDPHAHTPTATEKTRK